MMNLTKTAGGGTWRRLAAIGLGALLAAIGGVTSAGAQQVQPRAPADPTQGTYRSDRLGFEYRLVPYQGHYGARLTRPPAPGSPLLDIRLASGQPSYFEPGDMIVALDEMVIDGPADVENHVLQTTIRFVNVRTGLPETATAMFPPDAPGGGGMATPESRMVRAVLVVDTASGLSGLEQDRDRMLGLLGPLRDEGRCEVTVLEGPDATAGALLGTLRQMGGAGGDTVLVYYTGHGATDPARGHALTFTAGPPLLRSTLRAELARLAPRLTLLISDCCSNVVELPPAVAAPFANPRPNLRSLFLRTRGVVDLNGSTYDPLTGVEESAWGLPDGGIFTKALFQVVYFTEFTTLDRDADGLVTWAECLPRIAAETDQLYTMFKQEALTVPGRVDARTAEQLRRQASQTPQPFALDSGLLATGMVRPRELGVNFTAVTLFDPAQGNVVGARLDAVRPGLPAAAAGLEPGDIVTAVDGRGFADAAGFLDALARSAATARLRVRNVRDGRFLDVPVTFAAP